MRFVHFRVRTLMLAVSVVALVLWGVMMGSRSYDFFRRARDYESQERGWRLIASRNREPEQKQFQSDCIVYFSRLSQKYRQAMWCPWRSVAPDPHAPGVDQWLEQERKAKELAADPSPAGPGASREAEEQPPG